MRIFLSQWEVIKNKKFVIPWSGPYPSIADVVETMNSLIQNRSNHNDTCIRVKVSRGTQKSGVSLVNEESSLVPSSLDWGYTLRGDVRNNLGDLLWGKVPDEPLFAYDFVRIHSLMIYTNIVECKIFEDTKSPLLRCFPFILTLQSSDPITTGHYMNYQTFSNLQFRMLLKN